LSAGWSDSGILSVIRPRPTRFAWFGLKNAHRAVHFPVSDQPAGMDRHHINRKFPSQRSSRDSRPKSANIGKARPGAARSIVGGGRQCSIEFKEFAMRGNLIDMAVGIIMGVAFGGWSTRMVNDIVMPIVGKATAVSTSRTCSSTFRPQDQFASLKAAKDAGAATINYGLFINWSSTS
jgi:hypothetical protein